MNNELTHVPADIDGMSSGYPYNGNYNAEQFSGAHFPNPSQQDWARDREYMSVRACVCLFVCFVCLVIF